MYEDVIGDLLKISERVFPEQKKSIEEKTKALYDEYCRREAGKPKEITMHTVRKIFPCIAFYKAVSQCTNEPEQAYSIINEYFEKGLLNKDLVAYSFSYIGDEHIGTFYNDNDRKKDKFVLLLHSHINKDNIIYVSKEDAFTTENSIFDVSINVNELHTIDSLLEETENYNELYIKTEYVDEKCDAIVCFDELNDNVVDLAKKCNLPILLIDRGKYISKPKSFKLERNNHYVDVFSD